MRVAMLPICMPSNSRKYIRFSSDLRMLLVLTMACFVLYMKYMALIVHVQGHPTVTLLYMRKNIL